MSRALCTHKKLSRTPELLIKSNKSEFKNKSGLAYVQGETNPGIYKLVRSLNKTNVDILVLLLK